MLKLGFRAGDGADMVFLELVDRPTEEKSTETTVEKKEIAADAAVEKTDGKKKKSKEATTV
jgi:hypothetical protein